LCALRLVAPVSADAAILAGVSKQNVDVVRRAVDAFNSRDLDRALEDLHPDGEIDWSESRGLERGVYRGRAQVRRFYEQWLEVFEQLDIRPEEFIEVGPHVVVPNRGLARAREGMTVAVNSTQVFTLRDGKIVRLRLYQDKETALEAVARAPAHG
jgi:ketosteroid isomerase-like protein